MYSALKSYCQKALQSTIQGATQTPSDSIVAIEGGTGTVLGALSLGAEVTTFQEISRVIPQFSGFALTIGSVSAKCTMVDEAVIKVR